MVFFFPKLEVKRAVRNSARAERNCLSQKQDAANHLIGGIISLHKAVVSQSLLSMEDGGASASHRCPLKMHFVSQLPSPYEPCCISFSGCCLWTFCPSKPCTDNLQKNNIINRADVPLSDPDQGNWFGFSQCPAI